MPEPTPDALAVDLMCALNMLPAAWHRSGADGLIALAIDAAVRDALEEAIEPVIDAVEDVLAERAKKGRSAGLLQLAPAIRARLRAKAKR